MTGTTTNQHPSTTQTSLAAASGTASTLTRAMARHALRTLVSGMAAALVAGLLMVFGASAAAAANTTAAGQSPYAPSAADASYTLVKDLAPYVLDANRLSPVLHVDTEHANESGFWYARTGGFFSEEGGRGFDWYYQPWGMRCEEADREVVHNPWTNFYSCLINVDTSAPMYPNFDVQASTAQCRPGRPWSFGLSNGGIVDCVNDALYATKYLLEFPISRSFACAPWEAEQTGLTGLECAQQVRYPWEQSPEPLPWVPAPDACTPAPAALQTYTTNWTGFSNAEDPNCLGADNAPNCTSAQAGHMACGGPVPFGLKTGWPEMSDGGTTPGGSFTASASVTATGEAYTAVETRSRERKETTIRGKQYATKTRRFDGRTFTATKSANVKVSAVGVGTATVTVEQAAVPVTVTRSCTAETREAAEACAEAAAQQDAVAESTLRTREQATAAAAAQADAEATRKARDAAQASLDDPALLALAVKAAQREAAMRAAKAVRAAIRALRD